ncbi:MAG: hypothetical protein R3A52_09075 [Polyangiales bacterium]
MGLERRAWLAAAAAACVVSSGRAASAQERYTVFRVGADLGVSRISNEMFWQLNATGLLRLGPFRTDFYVPLRFRMDDFSFREADYASARDALRVVQCTRLDLGDYDRAEDRHDPTCDRYRWRGGLHERTYLSARLSPIRELSFGHSTLVSDFNNSLDPNTPQLGAQLDGLLRDIGEVRGFVDDVISPRVMGANVLLRPLQAVGQNWDETPDDLVLRAGIVGDLAAPLRVRGAFGQTLRDGDGNVQQTTTGLTALTADAHYLYLWYGCTSQGYGACEASRDIGLFGFVDYNRFLEVPDADGGHAGLRFRYRVRERYRRADGQALDGEGRMFDTWEVDAGAEGRWMGNRYLPGYFDGNYSVQSQQFALNSDARAFLGSDALSTSKLEYILSRPTGRTWGWQAFVRFMIPIPTARGEAPSRLPITLWAEDADGPLRTSVSATVGPVRLDQVIVGAQFLRRNFDGFGNLFSLDGALIRVIGAVYLSSSETRRNSDSFLNNLVVNFAYTRRFLQENSGALNATNDFLVTLGSSLGIN